MSAIEVTGLRKNYGPLKAVDDISFSVKRGEVYSLLGPNGAGKTTTIEILEGLRERDGGDAKVLGLDPWTKGYELHRKLGIIPQGFTFFPKSTPREGVEYYADLFGLKVDAEGILKKVILDDAARIYYENLSGGQKQKLGLALAIVNQPEVLFLDEPTTGLDPQARRNMWEVIRELKREGKTILLTTHYLEEARVLADRVSIMHHGKIIASGTPEDIISQYGSGERLEVRGDMGLADYVRKNTGLNVEFDGVNTVRIGIKEKHDILEAVETLDRSGMSWEDLRTKSDTLEDIFVKLVGGVLEEAGTVKEAKS